MFDVPIMRKGVQGIMVKDERKGGEPDARFFLTKEKKATMWEIAAHGNRDITKFLKEYSDQGYVCGWWYFDEIDFGEYTLLQMENE